MMTEYWIEVAHVKGILTSHRASADNPCEAARSVLEERYGIESWGIVPDIERSTSQSIVMYCDPIPTGDERRNGKRPAYRPLKVYVHGKFGGE